MEEEVGYLVGQGEKQEEMLEEDGKEILFPIFNF